MKTTIKRIIPLLIIIAALFYFLPHNRSILTDSLLAQEEPAPPSPTPSTTIPPPTETPSPTLPPPSETPSPTATPTPTEPPTNTCSCFGFYPPLHIDTVKAKKNRTLPVKAKLFDVDGYPITDTDIAVSPAIKVLYMSDSVGAEDVTDDAIAAGWGTDDKQFEYNYEDELWQFNLKTKKFTEPGAYKIIMISGDSEEYGIDPRCWVDVIIR